MCLPALLVFDLQFRLRGSHCDCWQGFRIIVLDERTRWDNSMPRLERVVGGHRSFPHENQKPQTSGIVERFHKTIVNEFYRIAFQKKTVRHAS